MQVILLHSRFSAKSITLSAKHILLVLMAFVAAVVMVASLLVYMALRYAPDFKIPLAQTTLVSDGQNDASKRDKYIKENLTAMAIKLGEMQAQLMRLDALGERVQGLAGISPEEFNFKDKPGRGGAESSMIGPRQGHVLSMSEFQVALDSLATDVEHRSDYLNVVESTLIEDKIKSKLLPTMQPVNVSYNSSGFGWRIDPFTGRQAFHAGIDFPAPIGTPIVAAAGGVVIAAEYHNEYGNMLEIDHGNDIVTRYGHTSKLLVKVGDIVKRGQLVAYVGSTGRSTGPHLHFEVLVKGVQQDPHKFLVAGARQANLALNNGK
jgi:murein DD-endopeptidase MepM/ murein hydrolase activator NlpD